jgi:hypothetical protein
MRIKDKRESKTALKAYIEWKGPVGRLRGKRLNVTGTDVNPLTPELNPSTQR